MRNSGNSKRTQRTWKPIGATRGREIKECQDELVETRRYKLAPPLSLSKFNESATNFARNSFGALQEAHQMHRDLKHFKADVVVKDAFISDLRQQLREIDPLVSQRDQLLAKRDQFVAEHKRVSAKCKQLIARRDQLVEERRRLSARQQARKRRCGLCEPTLTLPDFVLLRAWSCLCAAFRSYSERPGRLPEDCRPKWRRLKVFIDGTAPITLWLTEVLNASVFVRATMFTKSCAEDKRTHTTSHLGHRRTQCCRCTVGALGHASLNGRRNSDNEPARCELKRVQLARCWDRIPL